MLRVKFVASVAAVLSLPILVWLLRKPSPALEQRFAEIRPGTPYHEVRSLLGDPLTEVRTTKVPGAVEPPLHQGREVWWIRSWEFHPERVHQILFDADDRVIVTQQGPRHRWPAP